MDNPRTVFAMVCTESDQEEVGLELREKTGKAIGSEGISVEV